MLEWITETDTLSAAGLRPGKALSFKRGHGMWLSAPRLRAAGHAMHQH